MKRNRALAFALIIAMLLPAFASCSESTNNAETKGSSDSTTTTQTETTGGETTEEETEKILPDLPDVTYEGADFNIYCSPTPNTVRLRTTLLQRNTPESR